MNDLKNTALEVAAAKQQIMDEEVFEETVVEVTDQQSEADDMPKSLSELFSKPIAAAGNARQLGKTAELTQMSKDIAEAVYNRADKVLRDSKVSEDEKRATIVLLQQAEKDHDAMDRLIEMYCKDIHTLNIDFLLEEDEDELLKMLRSQQSKRSRAKSKTMNQKTLLEMMTGAVAELLLRRAMGKPKTAGGYSGGSSPTHYSQERIDELLDDPEKLKKAIRNVQSKISIAKSKNGFDASNPPESFRLLKEEEIFLKALRDNNAVPEQAAKAVEVVKELEDTLATVDIEALPDEAKELFKRLQQMMDK